MQSLGADPELLISNAHTGAVVPITGLIGGTKEEPLRIPEFKGEDNWEGYGLQEDNVMLEFNIPPARNASRFQNSVTQMMNHIRARLLALGYTLDGTGERVFSWDQLSTPNAQQFGCSAEYSAYTGGGAVQPINLDDLDEGEGQWRFAGGHVHFGYTDNDIPKHIIAKMCDVVVGLPSIGYDPQVERRKYYGLAGRFRPTDYGIEYRTLSNFWVHDKSYLTTVSLGAAYVLELVNNDQPLLRQIYNEMPWNEVQRAIDTNDVKLARQLVNFAVDMECNIYTHSGKGIYGC